MEGEIGKFYEELETAVKDFRSRKINAAQFKRIIDKLNTNKFGITISDQLSYDGESSLNDPDTSYDEESYDPDN
jgi:hypothetical protein